ncbi:MAG: sulfite exporter TauE/SafE family protein [Cyclobacteriaceae bacterium]
MEIFGYLCAILIGLSLGLIGGGGSILTLPVLVYLFGINPVLATAYSLFVVGVTSFFGAMGKLRHGLVDIRTTVVFAVPSFIAVYVTRLYLVPAIPEVIYTASSWSLTKNLLIMIFFAIIMMLAAMSMIKSKREATEKGEERKFNYPGIILDGLVVGLLTGVVGAGGGFLIVPALVILARLPMKLAIGTSLSIIAVKSLIGFIGDIQVGQDIDWYFLLSFAGLSVVGIFVGNYVSKFFTDKKLKKIFGWFVLVMSVYILFKELIIG